MANRSTLFYSWQSDHTKTRNYIENALKKALSNLSSDFNVEEAPRLDKDTQGEVGAVSITATIKRKIAQSRIFLADVSLIDKGTAGRKLANQNVMFELGYAYGKKGENAIMLIANSDLGDAKELPFDIAQNRVIFCSPANDPKAQKLIPNLEGAIKAHLGLLQEAESVAEQENSKEQLINAIENGKPTQTKSEIFFDGIYDRYLKLAPEVSKGGEKYVAVGERALEAYHKTLPLTIEFYEAANIAAEYGDIKPLLIAYKMIGRIAARYDQRSDDEYTALIIQELASIIIGSLAKYERWDDIRQLIDTPFTKPSGAIRKYKIENTYQYPEGIKQFYNQKTGKNYAIPTTPIIQERFIDNDKILQAFVAGSLVLMFALDFYYPYISGLLLSEDENYIPEFISRLSSRSFTNKFTAALGVNTIEELRERLDKKRQQPLSEFGSYWNRDITHLFSAEDLMPINEKVGTKT